MKSTSLNFKKITPSHIRLLNFEIPYISDNPIIIRIYSENHDMGHVRLLKNDKNIYEYEKNSAYGHCEDNIASVQTFVEIPIIDSVLVIDGDNVICIDDVAYIDGVVIEQVSNKTEQHTQNTTEYHRIANDIATIVVEKNLAYGDSFGTSIDFLQLLYPNGIQIEDYKNAFVALRMFDKLKRIATNKDALGENPFMDIIGYGLLALRSDKKLPKVKKLNEGVEDGGVVDEICTMMTNNCSRADLVEKLNQYQNVEFSDIDKKLIFHCSDMYSQRNYIYMLIDFFGEKYEKLL